MSKIQLTTWNINSVRLRVGRVLDFAKRENPDVICLQEIKCREGEFPARDFHKAGYEHIEVSGQKGYHGVAVASKLPLERLESPGFCRHDEARCMSVGVAGLEVHNLYVPAGGDEPDPETNAKFAHKLDFLQRMEASYTARKNGQNKPLIVVGDINIAPEEHDVWSHKQLLKVVSHTPRETDGLKRLIEAGGFSDIARKAHSPEEKLFTWWSYRARDWAASNRGRRLDHIWADQAATPLVDMASYAIHTDDRGGEKPSDHCPVSVRISVADE